MKSGASLELLVVPMRTGAASAAPTSSVSESPAIRLRARCRSMWFLLAEEIDERSLLCAPKSSGGLRRSSNAHGARIGSRHQRFACAFLERHAVRQEQRSGAYTL